MVWIVLFIVGAVTFLILFLVSLFAKNVDLDKSLKLMRHIALVTVLVFVLGVFVSAIYCGRTHIIKHSTQATFTKSENLENLQSVTENNSSIGGSIFCFYGKENSEYYYSIMKWENDYLVTDKIKADDVRIKYTNSGEVPHIDTYEYREYVEEINYNEISRYIFDFLFVFMGKEIDKSNVELSLSSKFAYYELYIPKDSISIGYNFKIK